MKIWKLDIGLSKKPKTKEINWQSGINLNKVSCGCWILSFGPLYITWMSSGPTGCYTNQVFHLKKKVKKKGVKK